MTRSRWPPYWITVTVNEAFAAVRESMSKWEDDYGTKNAKRSLLKKSMQEMTSNPNEINLHISGAESPGLPISLLVTATREVYLSDKLYSIFPV